MGYGTVFRGDNCGKSVVNHGTVFARDKFEVSSKNYREKRLSRKIDYREK